MQQIALTALGLYVVVLLRAGGTYALGRLAASGVRRSRIGERIPAAKLRRVETTIARWGAPVVAASFLTVGFQTAANFTAGTLRMPLTRYIPALAIGGVAWALIYATVGVGIWELVSRLIAENPAVGWPIVVALLLAVAVGVVLLVRRSRRQPTDPDAVDGPEAGPADETAA